MNEGTPLLVRDSTKVKFDKELTIENIQYCVPGYNSQYQFGNSSTMHGVRTLGYDSSQRVIEHSQETTSGEFAESSGDVHDLRLSPPTRGNRSDDDLNQIEEEMLETHITSHQERLGSASMAILIFYNVSGGPFGIETTVRAGGNLYAILGFSIMPFVWSLQEALMTAELGTTFPEASGPVAWVEEAFGHGAGWMQGYLSWVSGATGMQ